MGLSRLSKQCRECRYAKTCQHKHMEAVAVMMQTTASLTAPTATIDLEEIKENMRKQIYGGAFDIFRSAT